MPNINFKFKLKNLKLISNFKLQISNFSPGFTLVEILVAITILSVIGLVAIPNLNKFNDSQQLQNTTNDLVRVLREAQSSANSQIQCKSSLTTRNWAVEIKTNNFQLQVNCYDPTGTNPSLSEGRYSPDPVVISSINLGASPCVLPATITFSSEYKPFEQNRFSNIDFGCSTTSLIEQISLTKNSVTQYVCINKGGAIYASSTTC